MNYKRAIEYYRFNLDVEMIKKMTFDSFFKRVQRGQAPAVAINTPLKVFKRSKEEIYFENKAIINGLSLYEYRDNLKQGMKPEIAWKTRTEERKEKLTYSKVREVAEQKGISRSIFHYRRKNGWTYDQIINTPPRKYPQNRKERTSKEERDDVIMSYIRNGLKLPKKYVEYYNQNKEKFSS